ncbi:MAG: CDP-alcohol phosphatidyltransferase family protein, partial [Halobacteriaceae archaeon]
MRPRFAGRLGPADAITAANAGIGFLAVAASTLDVDLAARLLLLAGIGDALDGQVARRFGSSPVGNFLDGLADVAAFGVSSAAIVFGLTYTGEGYVAALALAIPA